MVKGSIEGRMRLVSKENTGSSTFCRQIGLEQIARAPSETRGQNWIQKQFRGESKPRNTNLCPPRADQTYLSTSTSNKKLSKLRTYYRARNSIDLEMSFSNYSKYFID